MTKSDRPTRILLACPAETKQIFSDIAPALRARDLEVSQVYTEGYNSIDPGSWRSVDIAVSFGIPCGAGEMDAAPDLRALVVPTIGYDWIDASAATERGILIANGVTPENYESVAEAGILLILAALYDLRGAEALLRGTGARGRAQMLRGRTIGLVGYGHIARALVDRLQGWGVDILVNRRSTIHDDPRTRLAPLQELVETADIIVIVADLNPSSQHLVGAAELARMKPGTVLVNLSRGGLIDEAALVRHQSEGGGLRLALDVFEREPLPMDSPLRGFEQAILTPHCIAHTEECLAALPASAIRNVFALIAGEIPASLCNPAALEKYEERFMHGHGRV